MVLIAARRLSSMTSSNRRPVGWRQARLVPLRFHRHAEHVFRRVGGGTLGAALRAPRLRCHLSALYGCEPFRPASDWQWA